MCIRDSPWPAEWVTNVTMEKGLDQFTESYTVKNGSSELSIKILPKYTSVQISENPRMTGELNLRAIRTIPAVYYHRQGLLHRQAPGQYMIWLWVRRLQQPSTKLNWQFKNLPKVSSTSDLHVGQVFISDFLFTI